MNEEVIAELKNLNKQISAENKQLKQQNYDMVQISQQLIAEVEELVLDTQSSQTLALLKEIIVSHDTNQVIGSMLLRAKKEADSLREEAVAEATRIKKRALLSTPAERQTTVQSEVALESVESKVEHVQPDPIVVAEPEMAEPVESEIKQDTLRLEQFRTGIDDEINKLLDEIDELLQ